VKLLNKVMLPEGRCKSGEKKIGRRDVSGQLPLAMSAARSGDGEECKVFGAFEC